MKNVHTFFPLLILPFIPKWLYKIRSSLIKIARYLWDAPVFFSQFASAWCKFHGIMIVIIMHDEKKIIENQTKKLVTSKKDAWKCRMMCEQKMLRINTLIVFNILLQNYVLHLWQILPFKMHSVGSEPGLSGKHFGSLWNNDAKSLLIENLPWKTVCFFPLIAHTLWEKRMCGGRIFCFASWKRFI